MRAYSILIVFIFISSFGQSKAEHDISVKNIYMGIRTSSYSPFFDISSRTLYWTERQLNKEYDTVDVQYFTRIGDTLDFRQIKNKQKLEIVGIDYDYTSIGNAKLSPNGNKMIFSTVSILEDTIWRISTAVMKQGSWVYEDLVYSSKFWSGHPTFTARVDEVVFSSVMSDGKTKCYGKSDLFIIRYMNDQWGDPENLGDMVNSKDEELAPFIHFLSIETAIYFASDNPDALGGLDIFKASFDEGSQVSSQYEAVNNVNTEFDDAFFILPHHSETAQIYLWASNKNDEKWVLYGDWPKPRIIKPTFFARGQVINRRTNEVLPNAQIVIREIRKPNDTSESFMKKMMEDTTGKYMIVDLGNGSEFEVISHSEDIFYESFKILIKDGDTSIVIKPDSLARFVVELDREREFEVTASSGDLFYDAFTLNMSKDDTTEIINFFFNVSEKLTLRINFPTNQYDSPYKYTLDSNGVETGLTWMRIMEILAENILLTKKKIDKLLLVGHTDDVGNPANNIILGQNRVNFIISELVKRGVPADILTGRAAGEAEPLKKKRGESKEDYRRRLRRVELQKVSSSDNEETNE